MINFDDVTKESKKEHNPNWPQIPDHPYIILIVPEFIECSNDIDDIYKNVEEYNSTEKHKISIVLDYVIEN